MGVVGVVLGVVPFDKQMWSLHAVVVRRPGVGGACPGEMQGSKSGVVICRGNRVRHAAEVCAEEGQEQAPLRRVEVGGGYSLRAGGVLQCTAVGLLAARGNV